MSDALMSSRALAARAEATNHAETSSITDVQRFFDACVKLPHGDRLEISVAGKSNEGRPRRGPWQDARSLRKESAGQS